MHGEPPSEGAEEATQLYTPEELYCLIFLTRPWGKSSLQPDIWKTFLVLLWVDRG